MDWIVSSTVLLRGPMCILILFVGEKIGLKRWLHISAVLAIGGTRNSVYYALNSILIVIANYISYFYIITTQYK